MSLKQIITEYLKAEYPRIVHKGEIGRKAILEWGYENENAGRRCRELENEGVIECIKNLKHEAQYRYKPHVEPESAPSKPIPPSVTKWLNQFNKPVVETNKTLF